MMADVLMLSAGHVSVEAGRSLQQDGVPVLKACLDRRPLQPPQMLSLLHQLACTDAWSKRTQPEPCSSYDTVSSNPLPEQQVRQHTACILSEPGQQPSCCGVQQ